MMKNKIIIVLLVLLGGYGFGQKYRYGDQYKDNIYFKNKTKIATFYINDKSVYKTLDLEKESPIDSSKINANIVNGYLLVTFYKYTYESAGISQMYIYNNKGEKIKTFSKKDIISYGSPYVTKDFKLLVYKESIGEESVIAICNLKTNSILEKRECNNCIIDYYKNIIRIDFTIDINNVERVFYFSNLTFKRQVVNIPYKISYNNDFFTEKVTNKKYYYKDLEDYVIKQQN